MNIRDWRQRFLSIAEQAWEAISRSGIAVLRFFVNHFGTSAWRKRIFLTERRVTVEKAEQTKMVLRVLICVAYGTALTLGSLNHYRFPRYSAEALRLLLQRGLANAVLAKQVYAQTAGVIQRDVVRIGAAPDGHSPDATRKILAYSKVYEQFAARAVAQNTVLVVVGRSAQSCPARLRPGTPWADPMTGFALPEGISNDEAASRLFRHWEKTSEHQTWRAAVASLLPPVDKKP